MTGTTRCSDFNPRSPRGGATFDGIEQVRQNIAFQSTLPTRGSDTFKILQKRTVHDFNPRSPRGGATAVQLTNKTEFFHFNPRSPRGGATAINAAMQREENYFNPRSPRGGATLYGAGITRANIISIHAPHEGERPKARRTPLPRRLFQSTLPTRGSDTGTPIPLIETV